MNFEEITHINQLDEIDKVSIHKGALIFKHSTRCAISNMAWRRFQREWDVSEDQIPVFFLDLIKYRDVSDAISEKYGVKHESPQALFIKNEAAVYNASHNGIDANALKEVSHV